MDLFQDNGYCHIITTDTERGVKKKTKELPFGNRTHLVTQVPNVVNVLF